MGIRCYLYALSDKGIEAAVRNPGSYEDIQGREPEPCLDLDIAWHGLHFLLAGDAWEGAEPLCFLLHGGQVMEEFEDRHPTRAISSEQVSVLHMQLSQISESEFRNRFDPEKMMEEDIYPYFWDRDPKDDDVLGHLVFFFQQLKEFVKKVAEEGRGITVGYT